jgi:hypothetical protein
MILFHPTDPSLTRWAPFPPISIIKDRAGRVGVGPGSRLRVDDLDRTIHKLNGGEPDVTSNSSGTGDRADAGDWADRSSMEGYAVPAYTVAIKNRGEVINSASSTGLKMDGSAWEAGFAKDRVVLFIGKSSMV